VLIEGLTRDNAHLLGRTENNRVINIIIPKGDSDQSAVDQWIGQMLEVKVTEVLKHTLRGEIVHSLV
jgi:tRNA-2-methylthio-N6-dimethylallyladenosine synthase